MNLWRGAGGGVSRRALGAGVVTGVAALLVSLLFLLLLVVGADFLRLSADGRYWVGYAPQFALVAGIVVGTLAWRRLASATSTPRRGALAGAAVAVGTVLFVPVLAGLYVIAFPVILGAVTGAEWATVSRVFPTYLGASLVVTRTVVVEWSPLVGAVLVPLGALVGWLSRRGWRPPR
ncbi:hypothetical protein [Salinirubrum litoreum]|uniref:Uncharacterized protein n=1 Tax=Salinirubrum litoreum TaxID=1126234 RepID=A0ABD5R5V9_9EURY|nr:hypothetical protein [Salinirubrum litoreum]